jgi:hypothetical protein
MSDDTIIAKLPTGIELHFPAGTDPSIVQSAVKNALSASQPAESTLHSIGRGLNDIPRQVGLTARYGIEGVGNTLDFLSSPIRAGLNAIMPPDKNLSGLITSQAPKDRFQPGAVGSIADAIGLPKPRTPYERVIGDASQMLAGAAVPVAAGQSMAGVPGMIGKIGTGISDLPATQGISAAASGAAGGASREAGGGTGSQLLASVVGGLSAPGAIGIARKLGTSLAGKVSPNLINVDNEIAIALKQEGIDWNGLASNLKNALRNEVQSAISSGEKLDPKAASRYLDFKAVGANPTRGMLTQDPVQITREQNLMRTGANSSDSGLQSLARNFNNNTKSLIGTLDGLGATGAADAYDTGTGLLGVVNRHADTQKSIIGDLYQQARDSSGRSAELDPHYFSNAANDLLEQANVASFLPSDIRNKLNMFAKGDAPLTVDFAEQLKTSIGNLQRNSIDGNVRTALGKVRQALDDTPLLQSRGVNPGNLPAVPGTVPPSASILGQESIDAFNKARAFNRNFMSQVESVPALEAALNGAHPDDFVKKFITGQGAKVADVEGLHSILKSSPQAIESVRSYIAGFLRNAAGATEDLTKFNAHSYNNALSSLGKDKLSIFFSPEEINQLRAAGRVGELMTAQPAGSAVNNSNSGALLIGKGLDLLSGLAEKAPFGLDKMVGGTVRWTQGKVALSPSGGLLQTPVMPYGNRVGNQAFYSGLLAAPVSEGNQ